jgi:hypothetical protein
VPKREVTVKEKTKPERMERTLPFASHPEPLFEMIKQRNCSKTFSSMVNSSWWQRGVGAVEGMPGLPHPRCALLAVPRRVKKDRSVGYDSN